MIPLTQHQVGDRTVVVAGRPLAGPDRLVHLWEPTEVPVIHGAHVLDACVEVISGDEIGDRDRSRVDHRVRRSARVFVERDRVERVAGRSDADLGEHGVTSVRLEREAVQQQFGHRLNGEVVVGITNREFDAVDGHRGDGELVGIDLRELGDVRRGFPLGEISESFVEIADHLLEPCPLCRSVVMID